MAASRRGQPALSVGLPPPQLSPIFLPNLPPISALFLIDFDVKAGYTITWNRAIPGLELEGVVEYKSLPSGLHTVDEDLIYFVHDGGHAGLSAFVNTKTDEQANRNARMIAVGVLVPLSYGRLGRSWRHAEALKQMATKLAADQKQTDTLEEYWQKNAAKDVTGPQPLKETSPSSPTASFKQTRPVRGHARNRSASDGAALIPPGHKLSSFHPAWSLLKLLDTFGPAIFPIHRAALLRKRILISAHAPVHEACNFVYNISVLSNIPIPVFDILDPSAQTQRLKPLFTVGVHDIPTLLEYESKAKDNPSAEDDDETAVDDTPGSGWIACTTDTILAMKEGLWDMLITMPPLHSSHAQEIVWPSIESPKGVPVKATQRDLRRFRSLKAGLTRLMDLSAAAATAAAAGPNEGGDDASSHTSDGPTTPTLVQSSSSRPGTGSGRVPLAIGAEDDAGWDKVVEPTTWAALAYNGFMWWASAGEQYRGEEAEEQTRDAALLAELAPAAPAMTGTPSLSSAGLFGLADSVSSLTARRASSTPGDGRISDEVEEEARTELAIVAYFHRLTTQMFAVLADVVEMADDDDEPTDTDAAVTTDEDEESGEDARLISSGDGAADEDDDPRSRIHVSSDVVARMGLDVWSQEDADFVRELSGRYFARRAYVEGKGVEICGLRVC